MPEARPTLERGHLSNPTVVPASLVLIPQLSRNLGSFERHGFGAFPVVLAQASITSADWSERMAIALSVALMAGYATVAFLNLYVP